MTDPRADRESPRPPRRRGSLGSRLGVVTIAVALLSIAISAAVSYGLVRTAGQTVARRQLGREADLVAGLVGPNRDVTPRVRALLSHGGIRLTLVARSGRSTGRTSLPANDLAALRSGRPVSRVETVNGRRSYVEARPRPNGGGVVLVQIARYAGLPREFALRLLVAGLIGLIVAALAGLLLAWRIARPLRRAAAGARRLAAGERAVRIARGGPAEVADVADSLNALAGALETSEDRQREFLMSVSHELRTPLTAISGYAEALRDGVTPPEQTAATGAIMHDEAARLARLIGDLLDLARLTADDFPIDPAPVDLGVVLADAGQVWVARCQAAGVVATVQRPPGEVGAVTDATRVRQLIDALAENALRVTPAGAPVVLALRRDADTAVIEVRDGGPGLSDDDLAVAFDRAELYRRYRGVRRVGTGLGLALVARLARRLGGEARAAHAPEGGACFSVRLPLAPQRPANRAPGGTVRRT